MAERTIQHEGIKYRKILRKANVGDLITHRYRGEYDGMPRKVVEITPEVARFETYYDYTVREEVTGFIHDAYMVLEEESVPQTGLTGMLKVGERVRYLGGEVKVNNDLTVGKVYGIVGADRHGDSYFYDDLGREWFVCSATGNLESYELVSEAEPQPDVHALLANLGRRLHEVESALAPKEYAEAGVLSASYPKYFKDVSDIDSIDVYKTHDLFGIDDPSGAIQHASKKLLLSGARTGGKSKFTDIKEARDTLSRWLEINAMEAEASE